VVSEMVFLGSALVGAGSLVDSSSAVSSKRVCCIQHHCWHQKLEWAQKQVGYRQVAENCLGRGHREICGGSGRADRKPG
jgi:hypothetical protein